MLNLLIFIHAVVISVAKLIRKACRRGLNWYWNVPDKDPLEEDLQRPFSNQEARDLAFRLKEDRKALHKRVINLKETLEHKVKVEVGEGTLRQRRQPGKQWSKDEIGGGEGSS
ncbi:hypothetical protein PENNAL_c0006G10409 [Penicillium nalgiovense]|uniref:Uncharacterized protein n=1 Tax=Penicillium nalgiovense TaxID=60175 RepID=A0A1V6YZZ4_PENNA|nr:hypothetical protein PENNAL_c0006G10409 [Penicillium nalgiovense]